MSLRGPRQYYYDSDPYWGSAPSGYSYPPSSYRASSYYQTRSYPYRSSYDYPDSYGQYQYPGYSYGDPYAGRRYRGGYGEGRYGQYPPYDDYSQSNGYSEYMDEYGDEHYSDYDGFDMGYESSNMLSSMAIVGMVIGVVSVLFCWMLGINNLVFIAAVVGFFLSMYGTITTVMGKRSGKGIAISALILNSVAIAGVIITQSIQGTNLIEQFQELGENGIMIQTISYSNAGNGSKVAKPSKGLMASGSTLADDGSADGIVFADAATAEESADDAADPATTGDHDGGSDDVSARVESYSYVKDIGGEDAILVTIRWTNDSEGQKSANEMVSVVALQGDASLPQTYVKGSDTFGSRSKYVEAGASAVFYAAFKLDDPSDVTLRVGALGPDAPDVTNESICKHL